MACDPLVFEALQGAAWERIGVEVLARWGLTIDQPAGQQTVNCLEIAWNYSAETQVLRVQCLDSPFYLSCDIINRMIKTLVEECQASR